MKRTRLLLLAFAVVSSAVLVTVPVGVVIGTLLGLPLLLVVPGALLSVSVATLRELELAGRAALGLGINLAVLILAGFALDLVGIALTRVSFATAAAGVTVAIFALTSTLTPPGASDVARPRVRSSVPLGAVAMLALSVAVFGVSFAAVRRPAANDRVAGYTVLTALPSGRSLIRVGVQSAELRERDFTLRVNAGSRRLLSRGLTLAPGERRQITVRCACPGPQPLTVRLLTAMGATYRQVSVP